MPDGLNCIKMKLSYKDGEFAMENEKFQGLVLNHLAHLTEMITGIDGEVSGLKGTVAGIEGEVTGLKGEVTGIKEEITGLKSEVVDLKGEVTGLKGAVTDLEGGITNIKNEVASLKKIVINIGNDHGAKLAALFDGFVQTNDKIDQVKTELLEQIDEVRVDTRYLISRVLGLEKLAR